MRPPHAECWIHSKLTSKRASRILTGKLAGTLTLKIESNVGMPEGAQFMDVFLEIWSKGKFLSVFSYLCVIVIVDKNCLHIHVFYKKLRIWACTERFLKLSHFQYSEFLLWQSFKAFQCKTTINHCSWTINLFDVWLRWTAKILWQCWGSKSILWAACYMGYSIF